MPSSNSVLFYAASFEVYPDDPRNEIWPTILQTLQNWIIKKEQKRENRRNDNFKSDADKHPPINISAAIKWNSGMRISSYTALLIRKQVAEKIEKLATPHKETAKSRQGKNPVLTALQKSCRNWTLESEDELELLDQVILSNTFANGTFEQEGPSSALKTRINDAGPIPKYWAMDYSENDSSYWWRKWLTCVGVTSTDTGTYLVTIQVSYEIDPSFLQANVYSPPHNIPVCARMLFDLEGMACISGEDPLERKALFVGKGSYSFEQFYEDLTKPIRQIPLAVVTSDDYGCYPVVPDELAKKLAGIAIVIALDKSNLDLNLALENTFFDSTSQNYPYRPYRNSVKVYFSNLDMDDPQDHRRHHLFSSEQFVGDEKSDCDDLANNIIAGAIRAYSQPRNTVCTCQDVQRVIDESKRDELARRHRGALESEERDAEREKLALQHKKTVEELELINKEKEAYANEIAQTKAFIEEASLTIEERDRQISEQDEYITLLEETTDDQASEIASLKKGADNADTLRWRNQLLEEELDKQKSMSLHGVMLSNLEAFPTTVAESLDCAAKTFSDTIVVLEEARKSAKEFPGDANEAWSLLKGLATVLHAACFSKNINDLEGYFKKETGYELSLRETKLTNRNPDFTRARERKYDNRTIDITPHVKGKHSKQPLRIYFAIDSQSERIVIGHCGTHLDTAGTKRRGF